MRTRELAAPARRTSPILSGFRQKPWPRFCSGWRKPVFYIRSTVQHGGYRLARAAHTISAFEVIQAIDGPLFITSCVTVRGECGQSNRCNIREPLRKVNDSIEAVLKRIKISHMREEPEAAQDTTTRPAELERSSSKQN